MMIRLIINIIVGIIFTFFGGWITLGILIYSVKEKDYLILLLFSIPITIGGFIFLIYAVRALIKDLKN